MSEKSEAESLLGLYQEKSTARTTDAEDGPSLLDVLEWSRIAMLSIVHYRVGDSSGTEEALKAIQQLTMLARLALQTPSKGRLRDALRNDPYCAAAYAHGARQGEDRVAFSEDK